jgi:hypothetical protein
MTTAELNWLLAAVSVAAYIGIGFTWAAPAYIRREVQENIKRWPTLVSPQKIAEWRQDARWECFGPALIWPLMFFRFLPAWADRRAGLTEYELEQRKQELQREIARLEREAGIR